MKICFLVDNYPTLGNFGGIAMYVRTAARTLAARGHEVHVLVTLYQPKPPLDTMDGAVHLHLRRFQWLPVVGNSFSGLGESFCAAWAFLRLHRRFRFDVVEYPNWQGLGLILAALRPTRTVARLYTSMAETVEVAGQTPNFGERFMIWAERTSTRMAGRIVTHSQAHRDRLQVSYGLGEVDVIPLGIPLPERDATTTEAPSTGRPSVLCVGPLTARKGIQTMLKAAQVVAAKVPDVEFWLAGGGKDQPAVAKQFREEHPELVDNVRFLGFVDDTRLAELYARCTVYASAAVYESFGLTFVEAMARGKAVVGCRAGAVPETVEHEVNGLLAPPGDAEALANAIARLLLDPDERRRFGEAGLRLAHEKFSESRMAENIERFLEKVCGKAQSRV